MPDEDKLQKINDLIQKVDEMKKQDKMDLSSDQDLSIAIMNLVSIEEHFFFTANKTGKPEYFDMLATAREMRKELLKKIVKDPEGEVWCISKHLLAASMRLMEVGTKALTRNNKKDAEDLFKKSYQLYSLFWGLNLKLIDMGEVKKLDDNQINKKDEDKKTSILSKLGKVVQSVIDCCKE